MVLVGFVCGIVVMLPLLFVHRRRKKKTVSPLLPRAKAVFGPGKDAWEQTRNFLYYDGTQMPLNKEETYE